MSGAGAWPGFPFPSCFSALRSKGGGGCCVWCCCCGSFWGQHSSLHPSIPPLHSSLLLFFLYPPPFSLSSYTARQTPPPSHVSLCSLRRPTYLQTPGRLAAHKCTNAQLPACICSGHYSCIHSLRREVHQNSATVTAKPSLCKGVLENNSNVIKGCCKLTHYRTSQVYEKNIFIDYKKRLNQEKKTFHLGPNAHSSNTN